MPTTRVIFWNYVFGAMSMGFASLYFVNDPSAWSIQTSIGLYALAYAIVFGSFFIYIIIAFVNKHSNPVLVTMFHPFGVLCVVVLSKIFLNEEFSSRDMLGAAFIVAGLMFVSYAQYASQKETEAQSVLAVNAVSTSDVLSDVVRDHEQPLLVGTVNR
jgi:drug/metabolite transporter (DMT)-like permease